MGLFMTFKHKHAEVPQELVRRFDMSFWSPSWSGWIKQYFSDKDIGSGTEFVAPSDWWKVLNHAQTILLEEMLDYMIPEQTVPHTCGCPECFREAHYDLVRLMYLALYVVNDEENPDNWGFSWSF